MDFVRLGKHEPIADCMCKFSNSKHSLQLCFAIQANYMQTGRNISNALFVLMTRSTHLLGELMRLFGLLETRDSVHSRLFHRQ